MLAVPVDVPSRTAEGVPDAEVVTHRFTTADGLELSIDHFTRHAGGDAVLVLHGLTTSTDMFVMPEHRNLVTCLLDEGYDVWCLDYRMSMRHEYNRLPHHWSLDDCALYDYPPAVRIVRAHAGGARIHVIAHCIGATTFMMSLAAGCVGGFASVVVNSTALTMRVPWWSSVKLALAPRLLPWLGIDLIDPAWTTRTAELTGLADGALAALVGVAHRECDVPACHLLSLMWGAGWPAIWEHDNLDERTHRRAAELFGASTLHYYRHIDRMARAGVAVTYHPDEPAYAGLPRDYLAAAAALDVPILFTTGRENHVFADSNVVCHLRLAERGATGNELAVFDGYGHQDVFMGRDVAVDTLPRMLEFLRRHS